MNKSEKLDSNTIKMKWARLPTFEKRYHEATNDALVSFIDFIPKDLFEKIKPFWNGYINYNGKKTALYRIDIIEFLLSQTYNIDIDGTVYTKSVRDYPGTLTLNKLLNLCKDSKVDDIQKMSKKQRSLLIFSQIKKDLWSLFKPAEVVEVMKDKSASFEWTDVKANKYERMYSFDLTNGLLYYEDVRNWSNEKQVIARAASLKDPEDNVKLFKLVIEYKKYGKFIDELMNDDFISKWSEGFEEETYAPKGKRLIPDPKLEKREEKQEKIETEMKAAVFERFDNKNDAIMEEEAKKATKSFSQYVRQNLKEHRHEIKESFEKVAIITNEEHEFEDKYLEELKSLDDIENIEDFLNL